MQNTPDGPTPATATPVGGYDVRTGLASPRHRWRWLWALLVALGLWLVCIFTTSVTGNTNLIPADILLGSFMVPVAAVIWNFDYRADPHLPLTRIFFAFVVGGTLGILMAAIVEALFSFIPEPLQNVPVGLIEEAAKLAALIVVAQRLRRYTTVDGLVLGSTVGFGFAALESSGYAFNGMLTQDGISISLLALTVVQRGMLAPLAHGLWTAVLGMWLFAGSEQQNRLRITKPLVWAYLVIAGIHATWDFLDWLTGVAGGPGVLSIFLDAVITGSAGLLVLFYSWNRLVRVPRLRREAGGGFQTAAGSVWQQPAGTWPPGAQQPPGYGYHPAAPPPAAAQQPDPWYGGRQAPPAAPAPGGPPVPPGPGARQQPPPGYSPPPPAYPPLPPSGYQQPAPPPPPGTH